MGDARRDSICRYVVGVSWPRSGHHLVVNVLHEYFENEFAYCEFYTPSDCCKSAPCARREYIKLSKNHDFLLKMPIVVDYPHFIQYRSFLPSVVSAFELFIEQGQPDTFTSFEKFATKEARIYNKFLAKWVFGTKRPRERLILRYEDLTSERGVYLISDVIRFFAKNHCVDTGRLARICESIRKEYVENGRRGSIRQFGINATRTVEEFRFYDKALFARLGAATRKSEEKSAMALGG